MAASDIIGSIGGMAGGMGGGIGAGIGAVTSIISGVLKSQEAKDQALRASLLRRKSEEVQKQALRPEYLKSLKMNEMAALYGLPELNKYEQNIDNDVANNARAIMESSPDGGVALNAINATLGKAYQAKNDLYLKDSLLKEQKMSKVADTVWNTGDKQRELEAEAGQEQTELNSAAMNLENSATANKIGSIDQILSTVGAFGNTVGKLADNSESPLSKGLTLQDGTQVSPETLAAIMATIKKGGGNVLPYKFQ